MIVDPEVQKQAMEVMIRLHHYQGPPIPILIPPFEAWMLTTMLQLVWRHPELSGIHKQIAEYIGRELQRAVVSVEPAAGQILELGWDVGFDVRKE